MVFIRTCQKEAVEFPPSHVEETTQKEPTTKPVVHPVTWTVKPVIEPVKPVKPTVLFYLLQYFML